MITAKAVSLSLLACAAAGYLCVPLRPGGGGARGADAPVQIDLWQPWGGETRGRLGRVLAGFNAVHPGIQVRAVYSPTDSSGSTKFFISVAAGDPPDLAFIDGPQVAAWAELGLLDPLDGFFAREQIGADLYWPPCWAAVPVPELPLGDHARGGPEFRARVEQDALPRRRAGPRRAAADRFRGGGLQRTPDPGNFFFSSPEGA